MNNKMFHVKQNKKVEKYFPGNNSAIYKTKNNINYLKINMNNKMFHVKQNKKVEKIFPGK